MPDPIADEAEDVLRESTELGSHLPEVRADEHVAPLVRRARLIRVQPTFRDDEALLALFSDLKTSWASRRGDFRKLVARTSGIPLHSLEFVSESEEWVRFRRDGNTPMIDFPRLRTTDESPIQLDTRICLAICTDDLSSKAWSRVGKPLDLDEAGTRPHRGNENLGRLFFHFRAIARATSDWAGNFLQTTLENAFPDRSLTLHGDLEISLITLRDEAIKTSLDELSEKEISTANLLAKTPHGKQLATYIQEIAGIDAPVETLSKNEPGAFWFSMPNTVIASDGRLESREMLYLVRPQGDVAQVVGIGFSQSSDTAFLRESALAVSRWIANKI